jgi:HD-GYP domain-containing protein (c-di-GMP phosphodiesterase class II)
MPLLRSADPLTADAVRLLSAIGDTLGGHGLGFGMRVATVAANFAVQRGCPPEMVAASFYAGALHGIGAVRTPIGIELGERETAIVAWDVPVHGARIVAAMSGLPPATSDYIRWHRESFDGTGYPDRLRWNGIPHAAMAINAVRAFVEALESNGDHASPAEALFALVGDAGKTFSIQIVREFRTFFAECSETFEAPAELAWDTAGFDAFASVGGLCAEIDARDDRTHGRGARLAPLAAAMATAAGIDPEHAAFAARLTALGRLHETVPGDDYDPLSRLGRDARAADARTAERLLGVSPTFAEFAPALGAVAEWFDGSGLPQRRKGGDIPPLARLLAVALAGDAMDALAQRTVADNLPDVPVRLAAAGGKQFDPAMVAAYVAARGDR